MHLYEISRLTVTSGECSLSGPGKAMVKIVQYLALLEFKVWFTSFVSAGCVPVLSVHILLHVYVCV